MSYEAELRKVLDADLNHIETVSDHLASTYKQLTTVAHTLRDAPGKVHWEGSSADAARDAFAELASQVHAHITALDQLTVAISTASKQVRQAKAAYHDLPPGSVYVPAKTFKTKAEADAYDQQVRTAENQAAARREEAAKAALSNLNGGMARATNQVTGTAATDYGVRTGSQSAGGYSSTGTPAAGGGAGGVPAGGQSFSAAGPGGAPGWGSSGGLVGAGVGPLAGGTSGGLYPGKNPTSAGAVGDPLPVDDGAGTDDGLTSADGTLTGGVIPDGTATYHAGGGIGDTGGLLAGSSAGVLGGRLGKLAGRGASDAASAAGTEIFAAGAGGVESFGGGSYGGSYSGGGGAAGGRVGADGQVGAGGRSGVGGSTSGSAAAEESEFNARAGGTGAAAEAEFNGGAGGAGARGGGGYLAGGTGGGAGGAGGGLGSGTSSSRYGLPAMAEESQPAPAGEPSAAAGPGTRGGGYLGGGGTAAGRSNPQQGELEYLTHEDEDNWYDDEAATPGSIG